jgi:hypothetical protein
MRSIVAAQRVGAVAPGALRYDESAGERSGGVRMVVVLMLTTVPDAATAEALADGALAARLAA